MTYGRRLFRCACIVLLLVLPGVGMAQWPECAGTCPAGGTCRFGCTELAVRKAVQSANACTGPVVVVFDRTLCPTCEGEPFKNCCWAPAGSCSSNPTCYVDMRMDNSALSDPTGIASCAGDPPEGRTLCLKGDNITFDGSFSLLLQYAHARSENGSVVMPCGPDPAGPRAVSPITIQGSNTLVSSLGIAYFPEGIRFETGQNNRIQYLDAFRICDDAIDTRSYFEADPLPAKGLPTGEVALSFFEGHTVGDNGFTCQDNSGHPAPCGLDKAIQINSGQIAVVQNQINRIPIPVRVCSLPEAPAGCGRSGANPSRLREHGPHTIASNSTTGLLPGNPQCVYPQSCVNSNAYPFPDFPTFSRLCRRICTGYQIGETGTVTAMSHISVRYCNWGVRVEANARVRMKSNGFRWNHAAALGISHTGAQVMVSDTTFAENACTSALVTGGNAQITLGQLNLGLEDQSSVSRVDLGGGQKTRVSVFDPGFSCATSNQGHPAYTQMCSTGGNRFCRDGARNHRDIDNTQVDGVGASVGIGASVAPSCFGTVGSVTDGSGRVRNRMNSGIVGTRCGTVNLPVGEAVGCALGSCDCTGLPPPE